ncbi:GNAT family N-acetyltransferase [Ideonella sp. DXS29W]|uniref:GNAT family N-acetyltransferase n=1 Tax=Ideonella lacteola TaxID=2984193 RepID=A0ABU9BYY0_9BURK
MKVTLRPAEQADFDFCFHAKRDAIRPHIASRWGWDEDFQLRFHRQRWSEKPWFIIVAEAQAVGTVSIQWSDTHLQFGEFYLLGAFQRRGIGTRVLQSVLQEADAKRLPAKLEYLKWNPVGSLYKRHGFIVIEETEIHYLLVRQPVSPNPSVKGTGLRPAPYVER